MVRYNTYHIWYHSYHRYVAPLAIVTSVPAVIFLGVGSAFRVPSARVCKTTPSRSLTLSSRERQRVAGIRSRRELKRTPINQSGVKNEVVSITINAIKKCEAIISWRWQESPK